MNPSIVNTFYLAGGFLALFGSAEVLYHYFHMKVEHSRKFVHFVTGLITLLFPILLHNHWPVFLLCLSFEIILIGSLKLNMLPSINAINRVSQGAILYPIVVYLTFLVQAYWGDVMFFYLPILILAISDPLAALTGKKWPWGTYRWIKDTKTIVGSSAFFLSALLISLLLFYFMWDWMNVTAVGLAIGIATLTTLTEGISQNGYDNLTVPLVASGLLILAKQVALLPI